MINDQKSVGSCCSICNQQFKDTEGTVVSHGWPVVCKECWFELEPEKRKDHTKAFFDLKGYMFNVSVLYQGNMLDLILKPLNNTDQVVYEVYNKGANDNLLWVIGLNDEAIWEADRDISNNLITEIGKAIETFENV